MSNKHELRIVIVGQIRVHCINPKAVRGGVISAIRAAGAPRREVADEPQRGPGCA